MLHPLPPGPGSAQHSPTTTTAVSPSQQRLRWPASIGQPPSLAGLTPAEGAGRTSGDGPSSKSTLALHKRPTRPLEPAKRSPCSPSFSRPKRRRAPRANRRLRPCRGLQGRPRVTLVAPGLKLSHCASPVRRFIRRRRFDSQGQEEADRSQECTRSSSPRARKGGRTPFFPDHVSEFPIDRCQWQDLVSLRRLPPAEVTAAPADGRDRHRAPPHVSMTSTPPSLD